MTKQTTTDTEQPAADNAQEASGTPSPTPEATETDTQDAAPEDTDEDQDDEQQSGNAEAAKWRRRLRDTEAERDELREQITAQHRAVVNWRASTAQDGAVDPQLLDAAGINIAELLDENGHLDMAAVDQFIDTTAVKFRVLRAVKPNPQQGSPSQARAPQGLASAFDPKRHQ